MTHTALPLTQPALEHAHEDAPLLDARQTIAQALETIRREGVGERPVYFYAVDDARRLVGVLPTRRLLTAAPETRLEEVMVRRLIWLPHTATVADACEFFVLYRLLALPVLDAERRVLGVVDVGMLAEEFAEMDDDADPDRRDDVFETIGFRVAQVRNASPLGAFRVRFPWLLATVGSGTMAALLAGAFADTLAESLIVAFFLTLVLGLGESVSMQSMTVTIQALNATQPTLRWYGGALRRETAAALLLGTACGATVAAIAWLWRGDGAAAAVIGASVAAAVTTAAAIGLSVPALLHALRLDPKIAAGPVTLALADLCTLLIYFTLATVVL